MSRENVKTIEKDEQYLRQISIPVDIDDPLLGSHINTLKKFCKENEVMAMASVQLGIPKRLIYLKDTDLDRINKMQKDELSDDGYDEAKVLINPVILKREGLTTYWEACASCLDNIGLVERPYRIYLEYLDLNNTKHNEIFEGFAATVLSHEYDHLNGVLHIDIAKTVYNMTVDDRKKFRQTHPYEIIAKDGEYKNN